MFFLKAGSFCERPVRKAALCGTLHSSLVCGECKRKRSKKKCTHLNVAGGDDADGATAGAGDATAAAAIAASRAQLAPIAVPARPPLHASGRASPVSSDDGGRASPLASSEDGSADGRGARSRSRDRSPSPGIYGGLAREPSPELSAARREAAFGRWRPASRSPSPNATGSTASAAASAAGAAGAVGAATEASAASDASAAIAAAGAATEASAASDASAAIAAAGVSDSLPAPPTPPQPPRHDDPTADLSPGSHVASVVTSGAHAAATAAAAATAGSAQPARSRGAERSRQLMILRREGLSVHCGAGSVYDQRGDGIEPLGDDALAAMVRVIVDRERRERRDRMIPWRSVFVVAIVVCDYFCCRCLPFPVLVRLLPDRPPHSPFPRSSSPPPRIPSPLRALFLPVIPFSLPPRGPRFVCREGRAINTRLFVTKEPAAPFCVRALGPPSRYCEVATGVPGRCPAFGDQRAGNNEGYAHARGKCANDLRWPARLVARKPERSRKRTERPGLC